VKSARPLRLQVPPNRRRIILFDHFHASGALFSDLVDIGTLHQAQTDVGVPQAVDRPRLAFTVKAASFPTQDRLELLGRSLWFARFS
jgi:hypothetical protein